MSKLVIKKRVALDFLGDDYKDAELIFQSVPLPDFEKISSEMADSDPRYVELIQKLREGGDLTEEENAEFLELRASGSEANKQNQGIIMKTLKTYFIKGLFPDVDDKLTPVTDAADLEGLDPDTAIKCFNILTGQDSPKGNSSVTQSPTTSPT